MIRNYRAQHMMTPYLVECAGRIVGSYKDFQTAKRIAEALKTHYVIRFWDRRVDESG